MFDPGEDIDLIFVIKFTHWQVIVQIRVLFKINVFFTGRGQCIAMQYYQNACYFANNKRSMQKVTNTQSAFVSTNIIYGLIYFKKNIHKNNYLTQK